MPPPPPPISTLSSQGTLGVETFIIVKSVASHGALQQSASIVVQALTTLTGSSQHLNLTQYVSGASSQSSINE